MAIFMWVYAFCSPLGGVIADRVNRKWLIVFSLGVWSAVTLLMGHVHSFHQLYWLRAVDGRERGVLYSGGPRRSSRIIIAARRARSRWAFT